MTAQPNTITAVRPVSDRARRPSIQRRPDEVIEAEANLSMTRLASRLDELLHEAVIVRDKADKRRADAILGLRGRYFQMTPEEIAAERIIDTFGPPEDVWFLREIAQSFTMEDA